VCSHNHTKHRVSESKLRSFIKALSFRIVEVIVDTIFLSFLFPGHIEISFLGAIGIEFICFLFGYLWERIWNKIHFGRKVICNHNNCKPK